MSLLKHNAAMTFDTIHQRDVLSFSLSARALHARDALLARKDSSTIKSRARFPEVLTFFGGDLFSSSCVYPVLSQML